MSARRVRNYRDLARRIQAKKELRLFRILLVANSDDRSAKLQLERELTKEAGAEPEARILSIDDMRRGLNGI